MARAGTQCEVCGFVVDDLDTSIRLALPAAKQLSSSFCMSSAGRGRQQKHSRPEPQTEMYFLVRRALCSPSPLIWSFWLRCSLRTVDSCHKLSSPTGRQELLKEVCNDRSRERNHSWIKRLHEPGVSPQAYLFLEATQAEATVATYISVCRTFVSEWTFPCPI
jgi:hypothetical protein